MNKTCESWNVLHTLKILQHGNYKPAAFIAHGPITKPGPYNMLQDEKTYVNSQLTIAIDIH